MFSFPAESVNSLWFSYHPLPWFTVVASWLVFYYPGFICNVAVQVILLKGNTDPVTPLLKTLQWLPFPSEQSQWHHFHDLHTLVPVASLASSYLPLPLVTLHLLHSLLAVPVTHQTCSCFCLGHQVLPVPGTLVPLDSHRAHAFTAFLSLLESHLLIEAHVTWALCLQCNPSLDHSQCPWLCFTFSFSYRSDHLLTLKANPLATIFTVQCMSPSAGIWILQDKNLGTKHLELGLAYNYLSIHICWISLNALASQGLESKTDWLRIPCWEAESEVVSTWLIVSSMYFHKAEFPELQSQAWQTHGFCPKNNLYFYLFK